MSGQLAATLWLSTVTELLGWAPTCSCKLSYLRLYTSKVTELFQNKVDHNCHKRQISSEDKSCTVKGAGAKKLNFRKDKMNQKASPFEDALQHTFFDRILALEPSGSLQTSPD